VKVLFSGVCTALVTPFKNGEVDFKALGNLIHRQIDAGVDALCILGTTGEASTLSFEEKCEIIKHMTDYIRQKNITLIFGIGGNNPTEIIKLGRVVREQCECKQLRVAVMLSAPYYNKCTQDGAVKFFNTIANAVQLPMIVYNVPGRTGVNLEPETLALICKNKYVCGIKEASGNIEQIAEVVRVCSDVASALRRNDVSETAISEQSTSNSVTVYCGDDTIALPCYSVGCKGIISVASNVRPKEVLEIWKNKARELYLKELPFYRSLFSQVNPIPVKYELSKLGLIQNELRLPLTAMNAK